MNVLDATYEVLKKLGTPANAKQICEEILRSQLWTTEGKTPWATISARLYVDINKHKGTSRFVKLDKGLFALREWSLETIPASKDKKPPKNKETKTTVNTAGYVYILTNPSFRKDWVKIGMTERPVNIRSKELDNTAVPLPFEIYATLKTSDRFKIENLLHGAIDSIDPNRRIRKNREFFNISPEAALKLLINFAATFNERDNVTIHAKKTTKPTLKPISKKGQAWTNKTSLAKQIAIRGGNEGAFGGILHYFTHRKPCFPTSKWYPLLQQAGIKIDKNGYVIDWSKAKNPLPWA